jgi:hypothetical protein
VADFKVLAKRTEKVAMGEKNRPRTPRSDKRILLSKMRGITGKDGMSAGAAIPPLVFQAVYLAVSGTQSAGLQKVNGLGGSCS